MDTKQAAKRWGRVVRCRGGMMQGQVRPRLTLTAAERERCRQVVITADRICAEQPRPAVFRGDLPPPMPGTPDRRSITWPALSVAIMVAFILMAMGAVR